MTNPLSKEDFQKVLESCSSFTEKLIVCCGGLAGMSRDEIIHMRPSWISLGTNKICIPPSQKCLCYSCSKKKVWTPKSSSVRDIQVSSSELKNLLSAFCAMNIDLNSFTWISSTTAWRILRKLSEKSKKEVTPYVLRATYGTIKEEE